MRVTHAPGDSTAAAMSSCIPKCRSYLCGGGAGAVEDAGGGADVHVQGGADVGVAGDSGDVGGVEFPGEQGGGAQDVAQAVPGPRPVAVLVAPAGLVVGGGQDAAVEVGGPPPGAARGGEQQPGRVGPGGLLGPDRLEAGGDLLGERVATRSAGGVDGLAALAALGRAGEELAGDLDDLAVHVDDPGGRVDLAGGEGEQLALPQPAAGRGAVHQLVQAAATPGGQALGEAGDVGGGRALGRVDELCRLSLQGDLRGG